MPTAQSEPTFAQQIAISTYKRVMDEKSSETYLGIFLERFPPGGMNAKSQINARGEMSDALKGNLMFSGIFPNVAQNSLNDGILTKEEFVRAAITMGNTTYANFPIPSDVSARSSVELISVLNNLEKEGIVLTNSDRLALERYEGAERVNVHALMQKPEWAPLVKAQPVAQAAAQTPTARPGFDPLESTVDAMRGKSALDSAKFLHDRVNSPSAQHTFLGSFLGNIPREGADFKAGLNASGHINNQTTAAFKFWGITADVADAAVRNDGTLTRHEFVNMAEQMGNTLYANVPVPEEVKREMAPLFDAIEKDQGIKLSQSTREALEKYEAFERWGVDAFLKRPDIAAQANNGMQISNAATVDTNPTGPKLG